jgi:hypothetical protein
LKTWFPIFGAFSRACKSSAVSVSARSASSMVYGVGDWIFVLFQYENANADVFWNRGCVKKCSGKRKKSFVVVFEDGDEQSSVSPEECYARPLGEWPCDQGGEWERS